MFLDLVFKFLRFITSKCCQLNIAARVWCNSTNTEVWLKFPHLMGFIIKCCLLSESIFLSLREIKETTWWLKLCDKYAGARNSSFYIHWRKTSGFFLRMEDVLILNMTSETYRNINMTQKEMLWNALQNSIRNLH